MRSRISCRLSVFLEREREREREREGGGGDKRMILAAARERVKFADLPV